MKKLTICGLMLAAAYLPSVSAGVQVGGTRLVYDGSKSQASINVSNPDNQPFLIQSWVNKSVDANTSDETFITTPPLFRLDAKTENAVRIVYNNKTLPQDRESVFWLNIKSIPSTQRDNQNVLLIAVKTQIKLFYRPAGLKGDPTESYKQLKFTQQNGSLSINNPTPYSVSLYELKINGTSIKNAPMILPFSNKTLDSKVSSGDQVTWRSINDYGGITKEQKSTVTAQ